MLLPRGRAGTAACPDLAVGERVRGSLRGHVERSVEPACLRITHDLDPVIVGVALARRFQKAIVSYLVPVAPGGGWRGHHCSQCNEKAQYREEQGRPGAACCFSFYHVCGLLLLFLISSIHTPAAKARGLFLNTMVMGNSGGFSRELCRIAFLNTMVMGNSGRSANGSPGS